MFTFAKMAQFGLFSFWRGAKLRDAVSADGGTTSSYTGAVYNAYNTQAMLLIPTGILGWITTFIVPLSAGAMFPFFM